MEILMKIKRSEYLEMKRVISTLVKENETLKKEIETLKKAVTEPVTEKKKGVTK